MALNLHQKAGLCLAQGKVDEAISLCEFSLLEPEGLIVLHDLACAYHVRSRQKQNEDDWFQSKQTFEKLFNLSQSKHLYGICSIFVP